MEGKRVYDKTLIAILVIINLTVMKIKIMI